MLDGILRQPKRRQELDYALAKFVLKHKNTSVLLSQKFGHMRNFTTRDSKLYFTQDELLEIRNGNKLNFATSKFDCVSLRQKRGHQCVPSYRKDDQFYYEIRDRYSSLLVYFKDLFQGYTHGVSMVRAWNLSLIGSLIFGMFLMTMIYRYLGPGAQAKVQEAKERAEIEQIVQMEQHKRVLGENIAKVEAEKQTQAEAEKMRSEKLVTEKHKEFEKKIRELVKGHPIEQMAPFIAKEEPLVAAMFIAIAKKESSWGKRVPVNNGKDCYNYVGFRLKTEKMGSAGHSCFATPKEGFERTVKRIKNLIYDEKMTTAKKMVIPWKCGYDCSWDSPEAVQKWVSDVNSVMKQVLAWKVGK